jgi:predicted TIM-barrel fold metal-dependent hydrolase
MDQYFIVSSDGHAGLPTAQYKKYLESRFHDDFDAEVKRLARLRERFVKAAELVPDAPLVHRAHMHRYSNPQNQEMRERCRGAWDPAVRLQEMDREGIAGEVIFPDGQAFNAFPFGGFFGEDPLPEHRVEFRDAGAKAHNRWLAEFCSADRNRLFGIALIMPHNIDDAVSEVRRAWTEGLRGVVLPAPDETLIPYHDRVFDPLWATCAELQMPVHSHGGDPPKIYGSGPEGLTLGALELLFFRRRILAQLIFGGVFERHRELRFVYTEVGVDWIPSYLDRLERVFKDDWLPRGHSPRRWLALSPRECWQRNCAVGATFATYEEIQASRSLGLETIMWGADYPHIEGCWPKSHDAIRETFAGSNDAETRKMVGENAARIYGFNSTALAPVVSRIGPAAGTFSGGRAPENAGSYTPEDYAEGWVYTYAGFARNLERSINPV